MTDVCERLEQISNPKPGGGLFLDTRSETVAVAHQRYIKDLCAEALAEIQSLRAAREFQEAKQ